MKQFWLRAERETIPEENTAAERSSILIALVYFLFLNAYLFIDRERERESLY